MAGTMGKTESAAFIPEIVANKALGALQAELYLAQNVARDSEYTSQKVGDKIFIPKRGTLVANAKAANTDVQLQNPTADKVEVTLDQHFEVTFAVEDVVKVTASGEYVIADGYLEDAVVVLAEKIESSIAAKIADFSASLGSAGTDITDTVLRSCRSTLSNAKAPKSNRFLYLEPDQINAVLAMTGFVDASKYGSSMPVQEGEFGKIFGMRVFESPYTLADGSPVAVHNAAMHRDALVLAFRPMPEPKAPGVTVGYVNKDGMLLRVLYSYNAAKLADQITVDALWGVAVNRDAFGIDLLS